MVKDEFMIQGCFWKWTWTNHTGLKLELALAKKLHYYNFSPKDEILGTGCCEGM